MRNPNNIRTSGQIHWQPLAYDSHLWIDEATFNRYLQMIQFPYPLDIVSVSTKKRKTPTVNQLPDSSGTAVFTNIQTEKKEKEPTAWATLDHDELKGFIFIDSTLVAEKVQEILRSNTYDASFYEAYGERIDTEIKQQLRLLIFHRYGLQLRQTDVATKEMMVDAVAGITSLLAEALIIVVFVLVQLIYVVSNTFELGTFLKDIAVIIPAFFMFYLACYKSFAALYDLGEDDELSDVSQRRRRLQYHIRNLFSGKNFPTQPPLAPLSIPLARSFVMRRPLIKGSLKKPN